MKRCRIWLVLGMLLVMASACGKTEGNQEEKLGETEIEGGQGGKLEETEIEGGQGERQKEAEAERAGGDTTVKSSCEDAEDGITLHFDYYMKTGNIEHTYEARDYTDETGTVVRLYFLNAKPTDLTYDSRQNPVSEWDCIEDEVNWYLKEQGYEFSVEFVYLDLEEFIEISMTEKENYFKELENRVDTPVDIYLTCSYSDGVEEEKFMDLTGLAQEEDIWNSYDDIVWEQFAREGRIYGIPVRPVATERMVYTYNPQLMELLDLDIADFQGNLDYLIQNADYLKGQKLLPLFIGNTSDYLNCGIMEYEIYDDIVAIRHTEDGIEAVDFLNDEDMLTYYHQLGELRQMDSLLYDPGFLGTMDSINIEECEEEGDRNEFYKYYFMELSGRDGIPNGNLNAGDETFTTILPNGMTTGFSYVKTEYYVPEVPAYIYEKQDQAWVVNKDTSHFDECCDLLRLYLTDSKFQFLLAWGIEGLEYKIEDEVLTYENGGPIHELLSTRSYWPVESVAEFYDGEIKKLNRQAEFPSDIDVELNEYEETYTTCRRIIKENLPVFIGYYGEETDQRLEEVHKQLIEAGYPELIEYINSKIE